jgi:hypothetical protein
MRANNMTHAQSLQDLPLPGQCSPEVTVSCTGCLLVNPGLTPDHQDTQRYQKKLMSHSDMQLARAVVGDTTVHV